MKTKTALTIAGVGLGVGGIIYWMKNKASASDMSGAIPGSVSWATTTSTLTPAQNALVSYISSKTGVTLGDALTQAQTNPLWWQGDIAINAYLSANS